MGKIKYSFKKFQKDASKALNSKDVKTLTKPITAPVNFAAGTVKKLTNQVLGITGGISSVFSNQYFFYGMIGIGCIGGYYVFIKTDSNGQSTFTNTLNNIPYDKLEKFMQK